MLTMVALCNHNSLMPTQQTFITYFETTVYKGIASGKIILNKNGTARLYPFNTTLVNYVSVSASELSILEAGILGLELDIDFITLKGTYVYTF